MTGLITDTGDQRLIRQSAAAIAARYGHDYYAERARGGGHIAELRADLGQAGLLGVHLPPGTPVANLWNVGDGVKEYANGGSTACAETARLVAAQVAGRYPLVSGSRPGWRPG